MIIPKPQIFPFNIFYTKRNAICKIDVVSVAFLYAIIVKLVKKEFFSSLFGIVDLFKTSYNCINKLEFGGGEMQHNGTYDEFESITVF